MKQDKAESAAVAAALPYGLRLLPVVDVPQLQCLAPELDLFAKPQTQAPAEFVGPREKGIPQHARAAFQAARDAMVAKASRGMYAGADHAEWSLLPVAWRQVLLLVGGVGDMETDLAVLAGRSWQEIPPPEREAIKHAIRDAKRVLGRLHALTLRTVE